MNNEHIDPIPEEFGSYEEAADFWDNHDTTDYLDIFQTVEVQGELQHRHIEVELAQDIINVLHERAAQQNGLSVGELVNHMLCQQISMTA